MTPLRNAGLALSLLILGLGAGCRSFGPPAGDKLGLLLLGRRPIRALSGLTSPVPEVRRWSILQLAEYGDPTVTQAVAALLDRSVEPRPLVRATACVGLRIIGDPKALPALAAACSDPDSLVRRQAVRALGALGGPDQVPVLSRILAEDADPDVRLDAALALGRLGGEGAVDPLIAGLEDSDPSVAFACHAALMEITGLDLPPSRGLWEERRKRGRG